MWEKVKNGNYRRKTTHLMGVIERGESGWWWFAVFSSKTGKDVAGGRRLKMKGAKEEADVHLKRGHLQSV